MLPEFVALYDGREVVLLKVSFEDEIVIYRENGKAHAGDLSRVEFLGYRG